MSFRPQLTPFQVITNGDMSGNLTSLVTVIQKISMLSYSYSWSGTSPVGAVSVQVSNDYTLDATGKVLNAGTWNTITFESGGNSVTSVVISGNTGVGFIDIFQTGAFAIRTLYTYTSGVGNLQAWINGKVS
jgi:hypothetical protein